MEEKLKDTEMESVLQNANDLFKNGNTEEAVELYKKLSEQGNAKYNFLVHKGKRLCCAGARCGTKADDA